jgi:hypothetical protein
MSPKKQQSEPPDPDLDRYFDTAVALGIIDPADFDEVRWTCPRVSGRTGGVSARTGT